MDVRKTKPRSGVVPKAPRARARFLAAVGEAYERFLELPVALVLAVMWVVGAVLLGSAALVTYWTASALVRALAGSI